MMQGTITDDQARALAALIAGLHPGWDVAGVRAAIHQARHRAPAHELAIAAVRFAMRSELRTPAMLGQDGPHWQGTTAAEDTRFARCPEAGHQSYPAWNCGACRALRLGVDEPADPAAGVALTPDQIAVNTRGAAAVRRALTNSQEDR